MSSGPDSEGSIIGLIGVDQHGHDIALIGEMALEFVHNVV
jgi:hypothetical protein